LYAGWHLWIFFFQAEAGIRDFHVTGVQTCALPIFTGVGPLHLSGHGYYDDHVKLINALNPKFYLPIHGEFHMLVHNAELAQKERSEEHTSELQSREKLVCRLLLEKKNP